MGLRALRVLRRSVDEAATAAPRMPTTGVASKAVDELHAAVVAAGIRGIDTHVEWSVLYVQCPAGGWEVTARSRDSVVVNFNHGRVTTERHGTENLLATARMRTAGMALLERVLLIVTASA